MHLSRLGNGERNLGGAKGPRGPSERARASQSRCAISGEHTRPRVWFATPRREHWGKTFDAGARRTAREARALPFELIPEPALSRGNQTKAEGLGVAGGFLLQPLAFSPQPSNAGCPGSSHVCHDVAQRRRPVSEWYRAHWDACGTNANPGECRAELSKAYREQQKLLLDVLAAMNGKPKAQQKQMLQQMRLTVPPLPK